MSDGNEMSPLPPEDRAPTPLTDPRARLRAQLLHTNPMAFNDPAMREFYVDLFLSLCNELEHVPGYGVAMMVVAERFAFLTAQMKAFDTQAEPLNGLEYQQLLLRFSQVFDRLLKGRDERSADESFKRQFVGTLIASVAEAIEETVPDRDLALRIQGAIAARLRKDNANPAVAQRAS